MKLLSKGNAIFDSIINWLAFLAGILILLVTLLICAEVVWRYFFRNPIQGTLELSEYALLYITFLALAWVLRRESHVKLELLLNALSPRAQSMVNAVTSFLGVAVFLLIAWYGAVVTLEHFLTGYFESSVLKIPIYIIYVVIPVGSLLFSIQFLRRACGFLKKWRLAHDGTRSPS